MWAYFGGHHLCLERQESFLSSPLASTSPSLPGVHLPVLSFASGSELPLQRDGQHRSLLTAAQLCLLRTTSCLPAAATSSVCSEQVPMFHPRLTKGRVDLVFGRIACAELMQGTGLGRKSIFVHKVLTFRSPWLSLPFVHASWASGTLLGVLCKSRCDLYKNAGDLSFPFKRVQEPPLTMQTPQTVLSSKLTLRVSLDAF